MDMFQEQLYFSEKELEDIFEVELKRFEKNMGRENIRIVTG